MESKAGEFLQLKWQQAVRICIIGAVLGAWAALIVVAASGRPDILFHAARSFLGASFFVLFAAGGIPEEVPFCRSEAPPATWMRRLCALGLFAVTVVGTVYPWMTGLAKDPLCEYWYEQDLHAKLPWDELQKHKNWGVFLLDLAACWTTGLLAMYCVWAPHQPSRYIRSAVRFLVAVWFSGFVFMVVGSLVLCGNPETRLFNNGRATGRSVGFFVNASNILWISFLVFRRVEVLDRTLGVASARIPLLLASFPRQLRACLMVMCIFHVLSNVIATVELDHGWVAYVPAGGVCLVLTCLCMGLCFLHVLAAFMQPLQSLLSEANEASDAPAAEARWAWQCLRLERNVIALSMTMSMCDLSMRAFLGFCPKCAGSTPVFLTYVLIWDLRDIADAVSITVLCGFIGKAQGELMTAPTWSRPPSLSRLVSTYDIAHCMMDRHPASNDPGWAEKVEELAGRGFELERLLDLFEELLKGSAMPSFDPLKSTTNDVVRQAIIPLSREQPPLDGGKALASIWSGGEAIWPERMVTHSWSNLFLHLVAAIADDALGECVYYESVALQLCSPGGVGKVRERLRQRDALTSTYWVCALSVNQHAGICGGFGEPPPSDSPDHSPWMRKRLNTTTSWPHPACSCQQPKFFSSDPVRCEMNKFDDMLDLLMSRMPGFRQVIAMDGNFDLLRRCWCLAEIVRTSYAGMPQNTLMLSADSMDAHYRLLATLDVRECEASNKEDKEFILRKIRSIESFNAQLQWLVFSGQGIFNRQLKDPRDRVCAAARVARRVQRTRSDPVSLTPEVRRTPAPSCACCLRRHKPSISRSSNSSSQSSSDDVSTSNSDL